MIVEDQEPETQLPPSTPPITLQEPIVKEVAAAKAEVEVEMEASVEEPIEASTSKRRRRKGKKKAAHVSATAPSAEIEAEEPEPAAASPMKKRRSEISLPALETQTPLMESPSTSVSIVVENSTPTLPTHLDGTPLQRFKGLYSC